MKMNIKYWLSALLILSAGLLAILVPGGSIETRSFSHINPIILGSFNTFLTSLSIGSILVIYFIFQARKWAYLIAAGCGIGYFFVYVLDLGAIFPVSDDFMPTSLFVIEIVGVIVSLPLTFLAVKKVLNFNLDSQQEISFKATYSPRFLYVALLSILLGCGIITFATISAMNS